MNYKTCNTCEHSDKSFSDYPCDICNSNTDAIDSYEFNQKRHSTTDAWEPNSNTKSLIEHGRRAGIEEAIAAVHTARKFPVSGQPASHVFDVVEAIRAILVAK